jgi:hypothetical protein
LIRMPRGRSTSPAGAPRCQIWRISSTGVPYGARVRQILMANDAFTTAESAGS